MFNIDLPEFTNGFLLDNDFVDIKNTISCLKKYTNQSQYLYQENCQTNLPDHFLSKYTMIFHPLVLDVKYQKVKCYDGLIEKIIIEFVNHEYIIIEFVNCEFVNVEFVNYNIIKITNLSSKYDYYHILNNFKNILVNIGLPARRNKIFCLLILLEDIINFYIADYSSCKDNFLSHLSKMKDIIINKKVKTNS